MGDLQNSPPAGGAGDPLNVNSSIERVLVGGLGGLAAILVKYISQDHAAVVQFISTHTKAGLPLSAIIDIVGGYFILGPMVIVLGAMIGWVSSETQRLKLFALGVSAPALITTLSSGNSVKLALLEPSSAYAQSVQDSSLAPGLSAFFGGTDKPYAIYVGSFATQAKIDRIVNAINEQTKSLHAITVDVTDAGGNKLKRIYVLQLFGIKEALDVRDKLLQSGIVDEATITRSTKGIIASEN
jgi:hypothetical protein